MGSKQKASPLPVPQKHQSRRSGTVAPRITGELTVTDACLGKRDFGVDSLPKQEQHGSATYGMNTSMILLKCSKCCQEKSEDDFYKSTASPTGHRPDCKVCFKSSVDMDNRRAYEKLYRKNHASKRSEIVLRSIGKNSEHHKLKRKEYLASEEGKAAHRRHGQARYSRKKQAFVETVCPKSVYSDQQGICYICGEHRLFSAMHLDHVVPISKGGKHSRDNCKIACAACNLKKGAKTLEELSYQMV